MIIMTTINVSFGIKLKNHNERNPYTCNSDSEVRVTLKIQDYYCPSDRDEITISPDRYDARLEYHGCKFGQDNSFGTPGGDCYDYTYTTPIQILHAINLILAPDVTLIINIHHDVSTLKKQLLTYQLKTGALDLISAENQHVIALQVINEALCKIFTYQFGIKVGQKLDALCPQNPKKIVPAEIHTVVTSLMEAKAKKLISRIEFEHLIANIKTVLNSALERPLLVKQEPSAGKTMLAALSWFSSKPTKPLFFKEFYFDLITGFKGSGLIVLSQQDIADQIDAGTKGYLPDPLVELVSSYVCK